MPDRPTVGAVEERTAAGVAVDGRRIRGVIPYGVESRDLGGWREVIEPTAFRGTNFDELRVTVDHKGVPLGRYPHTLDVDDGDGGLHWALDPPKSRSDVVEAVERGDVRAGSWRMVIAEDRWEGDTRHVEAIAELKDVCLVGAEEPAYPAAAVEYRTTTAATPRQEATEVTEVTEAPAEERAAEDQNENPPEDRTNGGGLRVEDRQQSSEAQDLDPWQAMWDEVRKIKRGATGVIEARTLSTAIAISPPELSTRLFDRLRPRSVVLRSGVSVVPIGSDSVTYPRLSSDVSPAWYAEGATITAGDPTLTSDTVVPQKVAHLVELTNEVIDDSEPSVLQVVRNHLLEVLGLKIDVGLLEGNGTPPNPLGLRSVVGIQTISTLGANGASPTNLDPWVDAVNALEGSNAEARVAYMHSRSSGTLRKLKKGPTGNIEPLLQGPTRGMLGLIGIDSTYISNQLAVNETQGTSTDASSSYVLDTSRVFVVRRADITIEVDRSRLFNADKSEIRAKARVNLYVPEGQAIARIVGIRP
jgi:HK97 family phage major capsid protein